MRQNGAEAERLAQRFLEERGLRLLERNYRCRFGEIDLVMREGETLVFVEVRLRTHPGFGGAAASITQAKRARLLRAARHYLAGLARTPQCRFDAVLLGADGAASIEWLRDAFGE
ncbi:MAG TPA: YraN family protein [Burkholderiales bacterium]